ncbi:PEP-CTERM sorting domain-containing protein [Aestuariibacter salexigens]|uniref:PEP-CTERM sorting domain-containing protein n=1 Tax=Aestuariibacter salexigens TaxID=226010 RepID=UPI0004220909|nr:PEP-CTERM sorting domain-containing protein [Aestuariibacter salexigens]
MFKRAVKALATGVSLLALSLPSQAALVTIDYGFGALPDGFSEADFNGDGIPNDPMSWNLFDTNDDGTGDLLMAIGASQRYASPALTNDGNGNFFATTGNTICFEPPGACTEDGPRWNFNFFIESTSASIQDLLSGLQINYELDPNSTEFAIVNLFNPNGADFLLQESWNLDFEFLNTGLFTFPGDTTPTEVGWTPPGEEFDRDALGTYSFEFVAFDQNQGGQIVGMSVTTTSVPEPSTIATLALGLLAMARLRRVK